jgi:hypothetical protein
MTTRYRTIKDLELTLKEGNLSAIYKENQYTTILKDSKIVEDFLDEKIKGKIISSDSQIVLEVGEKKIKMINTNLVKMLTKKKVAVDSRKEMTTETFKTLKDDISKFKIMFLEDVKSITDTVIEEAKKYTYDQIKKVTEDIEINENRIFDIGESITTEMKALQNDDADILHSIGDLGESISERFYDMGTKIDGLENKVYERILQMEESIEENITLKNIRDGQIISKLKSAEERFESLQIDERLKELNEVSLERILMMTNQYSRLESANKNENHILKKRIEELENRNQTRVTSFERDMDYRNIMTAERMKDLEEHVETLDRLNQERIEGFNNNSLLVRITTLEDKQETLSSNLLDFEYSLDKKSGDISRIDKKIESIDSSLAEINDDIDEIEDSTSIQLSSIKSRLKNIDVVLDYHDKCADQLERGLKDHVDTCFSPERMEERINALDKCITNNDITLDFHSTCSDELEIALKGHVKKCDEDRELTKNMNTMLELRLKTLIDCVDIKLKKCKDKVSTLIEVNEKHTDTFDQIMKSIDHCQEDYNVIYDKHENEGIETEQDIVYLQRAISDIQGQVNDIVNDYYEDPEQDVYVIKANASTQTNNMEQKYPQLPQEEMMERYPQLPTKEEMMEKYSQSPTEDEIMQRYPQSPLTDRSIYSYEGVSTQTEEHPWAPENTEGSSWTPFTDKRYSTENRVDPWLSDEGTNYQPSWLVNNMKPIVPPPNSPSAISSMNLPDLSIDIKFDSEIIFPETRPLFDISESDSEIEEDINFDPNTRLEMLLKEISEHVPVAGKKRMFSPNIV